MTYNKKKHIFIDIFLPYLVIFFLWLLYRLYFSFPEWLDEFVAKPILWIAPLLVLQGNIFTGIQKNLKLNTSQNIKRGLFAGFAYFTLFTLLSRFTNLPSVNPDGYTFVQLVLQVLIAFSTGFIEEIVFRTHILEKSLLIFHDSIIANSFTSFLFAAIHLPIIIFVYKYPVSQALPYLLLLFLSGFIYGLVYLKNKSLIASTMTHAVWNFLGTILR